MKKFKVGDRVRITKPEITTIQVSEGHSVDWVEEMDYLDSTIQEITGIGYGSLPDIECLDSKGGKLKWALHPDWCELVSDEKEKPQPLAFQRGDFVRVLTPSRESFGKLALPEAATPGEIAKVKDVFPNGDIGVEPITQLLADRTVRYMIKQELCEIVKQPDFYREVAIPQQSSIAKMKIYIAGKITGLEYGYVEACFDHAKQLIEKWGFEAVSPLDYGDESKSWVENMLLLLPILNTCDGIYLLDNWEDSDGARIEKKFAEKKGMFVIKEVV